MKPISAEQNFNATVISGNHAQTVTIVDHIGNLRKASNRDATDGAPEAVRFRPDPDSGRRR
ncbi:hypothetical protein [Amycolatopsis sp.]|uniref:hypothetical protein n=1 Tax=Amycolatopsis sp. TaxID=37632 RepID=UPI002D7E823E|nr:hypothetical protein [Amycolatopsis sp.]HET6707515.1 hypothetical protein [Amycolatopsis sp.]